MFEDSIVTRGASGRPPRDRIIGAAVTLLFHGLLGFVVYHGRFTVKVLPFEKEEVRNVVIVPPLKVSIPKIVGGRGLAELPGLTEEPGIPGPAGRRIEKPLEGEAKAPGGEPSRQPGTVLPPPGAASAIPSLSTKFEQSLAVHGRSDLTIPLAPPGTPAGPPGFGGGAPLPDFSRYDRGAYGGSGGRGTGGGSGGGTGGRQRVGISIPLKGYDLLPWASTVIDRLQLHWNLPAVQALPEASKISMIVVIKKSGELESIEILEGTTVEPLDRAALEAVRASLPFPALPADFPGDFLEITFEFVYND